MLPDALGVGELIAAGPHDQTLRQAQQQVEQAEQALQRARQARAMVVHLAYSEGYSIYRLGRLTGGRKPPALHRDLARANRPENPS